MKKINRITLISLITLMFQFAFAQSELIGSWKVSCPFEKTEGGAGKLCDLCPVNIKDASGLSISDFKMNIGESDMILDMGNLPVALKYTWHQDINAIEFQYNKQNYKFKVLESGEKNRFILKNSDGLIISIIKT